VHLRAVFIHTQYQPLPKIFLFVCRFVVHLVVIIHNLVTLAYIYWCCFSKGFTCFKNAIVPCTVFDFTCCV